MAERPFKRADRVAERIRSELMELLLRGAVRDPRAKDAIVSNVHVTDDLGIARVYLRTLQGADASRAEELVEVMTHAGGFLRRELGQRLSLKFVPQLEFYWDDVVDSALRIESILSEIAEDDS